MKTKWMLVGLMAVAIGIVALGATGCGKPDHNHDSGEHMHDHGTSATTPDSKPAAPAPDTNSVNTSQSAPDTANTNQAAVETKPAPAKQYTCPMHPEVVQDAPGKCPKCGMKLVEKK